MKRMKNNRAYCVPESPASELNENPLDPQKSKQQEIGPRLPLFSTKDESGQPIFLIRLSELLKDVYYERRASHSQAAKAKQERKVSPLLSGPFTLVDFSGF